MWSTWCTILGFLGLTFVSGSTDMSCPVCTDSSCKNITRSTCTNAHNVLCFSEIAGPSGCYSSDYRCISATYLDGESTRLIMKCVAIHPEIDVCAALAKKQVLLECKVSLKTGKIENSFSISVNRSTTVANTDATTELITSNDATYLSAYDITGISTDQVGSSTDSTISTIATVTETSSEYSTDLQSTFSAETDGGISVSKPTTIEAVTIIAIHETTLTIETTTSSSRRNLPILFWTCLTIMCHIL